MRPSGRNARRQGSSKVATVVMVKGRPASGFCSPALTCAQAAAAAKVSSKTAFANLIVNSPCFSRPVLRDPGALSVLRAYQNIYIPALNNGRHEALTMDTKSCKPLRDDQKIEFRSIEQIENNARIVT